MKSIFFLCIKICFFFFGRSEGESWISTLYQRLYSIWICQKFKCKNVIFKRRINKIIGCKYFKIGEFTVFGKLAVLTAYDKRGEIHYNPKIKIGNRCNFGDFLHLTCINKITIGNNILTGRWVTISDNGHGRTDYENLTLPPSQRELYSKGPIVIEDNVWIGDKATILSGVTIGEGSVIGANSVVTKNIPPFSVAAGNPAKVIKEHFNK